MSFKKYTNQGHPYHLVDLSPWPLFAGLSLLTLTVGFVSYMHGFGDLLLKLGIINLIVVMIVWWRDVIRESTFEGQHTKQVQEGIKIGFLLFILSEIMFFFAFFWAFFYFAVNPSIFIGGIWPPMGLTILNPWKIPLLNTILLVSSGVTLTLAHHSIVYGVKELAIKALLATIGLALFFTLLQYYEYSNAPFSISTSSYGSAFYMLTGLHGLHVLIGSIFLSTCLIRLYFNHFTRQRHTGFETAAWYWHFVDIVWILLYVVVYIWGSFF